jgi:hypothetical protein
MCPFSTLRTFTGAKMPAGESLMHYIMIKINLYKKCLLQFDAHVNCAILSESLSGEANRS